MGTVSDIAGVAEGSSPTFGAVTLTGSLKRSTATGITAGSTQTQAGATALTTDINEITVSGTDGDGVKLPTAAKGLRITVINADAAQTIQIWPSTGDDIDGGAADAVDANALSFGDTRDYASIDGTSWYSLGASVAAGGAWTKLAAVDASTSSTVDIEDAFDDTYDMYVIIMSNINLSNNTSLSARVKVGGSYITASGYAYHIADPVMSSAAYSAVNSNTTTSVPLTGGATASNARTQSFKIEIPEPYNTVSAQMFRVTGTVYDSSLDLHDINGSGMQTTTGALQGFRFFPGFGTIISGTATLYGISLA